MISARKKKDASRALMKDFGMRISVNLTRNEEEVKRMYIALMLVNRHIRLVARFILNSLIN